MKRILALALALVLVLSMGATAFAAEASGKFVVSSEMAEPGDVVQITISIQDNPGVASIELNVEFDETALELTKVEKGTVVDPVGPLPEGAFAGFFDPVDEFPGEQPANRKLSTLTWFKDTASETAANNTADGTFATLTFKVKADATEGDYPVSVSFVEKNVHDIDEQPVPFTAEAGKVTVKIHTPGDVNGDGRVNINDVIRLAAYVKARGDGVIVMPGSPDTNGDGRVNINDVIRLAAYVKARGQDVDIY